MSDHLIAVQPHTRSAGRCSYCRAAITWYRSYPDNRAVPFCDEVVALKTGRSEADWTPIEYLSEGDRHRCRGAA